MKLLKNSVFNKDYKPNQPNRPNQATMSKNDVVFVYKIRTTSGNIAYIVYYDHNNADVVDCFSFAEFRERFGTAVQTQSLETAIHIARGIQREETPEYSFVVYDGYLNAFLEGQEQDKPTPSYSLRLVTNPVYFGESEDSTTDESLFTSTGEVVALKAERDSFKREATSAREQVGKLEEQLRRTREENQRLESALITLARTA